MMSLADGFLDALQADFEHVAPTAFTDGRENTLPKAEFAGMKDWSTVKSLSDKDFPQLPPSDYKPAAFRPSSHQRKRSAERESSYTEDVLAMQPNYNYAGGDHDGDDHGFGEERDHYTGHGQEREGHFPVTDYFSVGGGSQATGVGTASTSSRPIPTKGGKLMNAQTGKRGWVYSQGWNNRPRPGEISVSRIMQETHQKAKMLNARRAAAPVQIGKKHAASFGKIPDAERARPPNYAQNQSGEDVARLRYILVDLSAARKPGPRYVLDPVKNKRERPNKFGHRRVQGSSLVTGFSKSIMGKSKEYPSIDSRGFDPDSIDGYGEGGAFQSICSERDLRSAGEKGELEAPNSGILWGERTTSGSIYEKAMNSGGPGPSYDVNISFLRTSVITPSQTARFSPVGSKPGTPLWKDNPASKPMSRQNPRLARLAPELSQGFLPY